MSNRTLIWLTALVLLAMLILFSINITSILTGQPESQTYLKFNNVRGMAVSHNQLLYTLNFKQQNSVINILNRAVKVTGINTSQGQKPDIEKIVVYLFNNQPELIIHPIAYVDNNLIFSVPQWEKDGNLMELSDGQLKELLSHAYDH